MSKTILFNPISVVHDRHVRQFRGLLKDWRIRCIYNTKFPWFSDKQQNTENGIFCFSKGYFQKAPKNIFDGVSVLILFTSQPRVPPCSLIQEATLRNIPIVAIEEVYQMMLQQGTLNNYLLPADHFFVGSDYEKDKFIDLGVSSDGIEVTGCMFRRRRDKPLSKNMDLMDKFGLSGDKPVLTLCLDALSSEVDPSVNNHKLINHVFDGMPPGYELLIKPHPEDKMQDFAGISKNISQKIKIVDPKVLIDDILDVTDILLNRGNSQVIIDALEMGIPVVVVPFKKETFFRGVLDVVIADNDNLRNTINYAQSRGIGLYDVIFQKYLYISPAQATENIINRIEQIAENRQTRRAQERLLELAIFWVWMGYLREGKSVLCDLKNSDIDSSLLNSIYRMISCKADRNDLSVMKEWAGIGYRKSVTQSLWIKNLYLSKEAMDSSDRGWFDDFPPRPERQRFLSYAIMLCWCYLNSGMDEQARILADELAGEFFSPPINQKLKSFILTARKKPFFEIEYFISRINYSGRLVLKNLILR